MKVSKKLLALGLIVTLSLNPLAAFADDAAIEDSGIIYVIDDEEIINETTTETEIAEADEPETLMAEETDSVELMENVAKCGANVYCKFNESTKTLSVYGSGAMYNFSYFSDHLWEIGQETAVSGLNINTYEILNIDIAYGVTSIGAGAFAHLLNVTNVTIPNSVTTIGECAFWDTRIDNPYIPNSVTSIGKYAFVGSKNLTIPGSVKKVNSIEFIDTKDYTLVLQDGVKEIGDWLFGATNYHNDVYIPNSVTYISKDAFTQSLKTTIHADFGSYAHEYAKSHNIDFVSTGCYKHGGGTATCRMRAICAGCGELYGVINPNNHTGTIIRNQRPVTTYENGYSGDVYCIDCGCFLEQGHPLFMPAKNIKATVLSEKSVKLTWDPVPDAAGYIVEKFVNGSNQGYVRVTSTNYIDTNATSNVYNYYFIHPYYMIGQYGYRFDKQKNYVYAKPCIQIPKLPAVTNLKTSSINGGVLISWAPVSGADGYLIYGFHGSPNNGAKYGYIGMTSSTTFADMLALSTDWNFYYVFAYNKDSSGKMIPGGYLKYVYGKAR